ncbi:hypothetical protein [Ruminococcus flavefaciens]|uniref:hypothetical protein n=1 Tax=Ruminococcus flavefaciens TaxID=1265 RepID=UPI000465129F|nr:hypothetical protein [Ruminococcus flavefaciens]
MKVIKALVTSSLIAAAMLTGCADKQTESSAPESESSGSVSGEITLDTDVLESKYNVHARYMNNYLFDTPEEVSSATVDIPAGNIVIEHSGDNKSGYSIVYSVYGDTQEVLDEINTHIDIKSEIKGNEQIMTLVEAETGEDIDTWFNKTYPNCFIFYDAYVTVPAYVTDFKAICGTGDVDFAEMSGSFTADVGVGHISFTDTEITGPSVIKCDTGNITMDNITYKGKTDISAETGNITFCLPLNGSGGADISVKADTGNIEVTGIKNYDVKGEDKNGTSKSLSIGVENCNIDFAVNTGDIKIDKE